MRYFRYSRAIKLDSRHEAYYAANWYGNVKKSPNPREAQSTSCFIPSFLTQTHEQLPKLHRRTLPRLTLANDMDVGPFFDQSPPLKATSHLCELVKLMAISKPVGWRWAGSPDYYAGFSQRPYNVCQSVNWSPPYWGIASRDDQGESMNSDRCHMAKLQIL